MTVERHAETQWPTCVDEVLSHYLVTAASVTEITQGLVNLTYAVQSTGGERYALQRLHAVFTAEVNVNIAHVTAHLAVKGLCTPTLIPTAGGELAVLRGAEIWRLMTWVDGRAYDALQNTEQAAAAAGLLAHFHLALTDYAGPLAVSRPPTHDFVRHRARLTTMLATHKAHHLYAAVRAATVELDAYHAVLPRAQPTLPRVVHGDPKISNVLFDADGREALALIDLDTLARMPLALELGDALRSWCNPHGEDAPDATFDLAYFDAALAGYAAVARVFVTPDEIRALVPATLEIHLELAARFLADALDETYFGWDARRYASRGAHNLARARGQLYAARSLGAQTDEADALVRRHFAVR